MKTFLAAFCAIFLGGLAFADGQATTNNTVTNLVADSIDQLVARLSSDGMWQNGLFKPVDLPPSATPEEVISQVDKLTGLYQGGKLTSYRIIETRQVQIGSDWFKHDRREIYCGSFRYESGQEDCAFTISRFKDGMVESSL